MSTGVRTEWVEHARAVLDEAGHRKARARNALIDLLASQPCALSPMEIEDRLREGDQRVARASIYRILELLGEHGLVARLELGDGTTRYELIDPEGDHHHHLLCDSCGRVVPFGDRDLERAIERLARRLDFRTNDHEVVLHGACRACQSYDEPASRH
jgi:Fur family ferric uptake transcriptional regulator